MSSYVNHHHHHRHHQHRVRFCTRTWLSTVSQLHYYDTGFQMNIFANMDLLAIWAVIFGPLDSKCINYSRTNESFPLKSSAHDSSRNRKHKSLTKRLEQKKEKKKKTYTCNRNTARLTRVAKAPWIWQINNNACHAQGPCSEGGDVLRGGRGWGWGGTCWGLNEASRGISSGTSYSVLTNRL